MTDTPTNPAEGETPEAEVETPEVETEVSETQYDDNGEPIEPEAAEIEDDSEEVEHDGQKYKIPKALKSALLFQADYTRKTQEVAEERRALAAEREAFTAREAAIEAAAQDVVEAKAKAVALSQTLAEYDDVDWNGWEQRIRQLRAAGRHEDAAQDQFDLDSAWRKRDQLKQAHTTALSEAETKAKKVADDLTAAQSEERTKLLREGHAVLARDIPNWGPELGRELIGFGSKAFGFTPDEIAGITDPRMMKVLHAVFLADKASKETAAADKTRKTVQTLEQQQQVRPAATVGARSPATTPSTATPASDRLSTEAWMKQEQARLARKATR